MIQLRMPTSASPFLIISTKQKGSNLWPSPTARSNEKQRTRVSINEGLQCRAPGRAHGKTCSGTRPNAAATREEKQTTAPYSTECPKSPWPKVQTQAPARERTRKSCCSRGSLRGPGCTWKARNGEARKESGCRLVGICKAGRAKRAARSQKSTWSRRIIS